MSEEDATRAVQQAMADNPEALRQAMEQMQAQLQARLTAEAEEFLKSLPEDVQKAVHQLKALQTQHDTLETEYRKQRVELEEKYRKLYAPLYAERTNIVASPAGVPKFWLTALQHHPMIGSSITEKDEAVLEYLTDISSAPLAEGTSEDKGFKLTFTFRNNPYFSNSELVKTYLMADDDEPILEKIEGCDIAWKPGQNVTVKVLKKKPRKPGQKPLTKTEPAESFFNFFNPPELPDDEDMDAEEADELQAAMEEDYDVGCLLRAKIVPQAVLWFTGEAVSLDDYYEESEGESDEEEEEEDDDDDDEEEASDSDEDEDDEDDDGGGGGAAKKRMPMPAGAGGKEGEQPPECKQQ